MAPLQILIVEDDENDVILLQKELRAGGLVFESRLVDTQAGFVQALEESIPDLIIADFQLPRFDALTALELSQLKTRRTPFIIFTGCLDEATAVLCMKLGAWDYVLKQNPVRLVACIRSALERRRLVDEKEQAIREGEQRFRQLADVAPVLFWMSDASGSFQYFNRFWLAFRGRTEMEERNEGWLEGLHPDDRTRCEHVLHSRITTLQPIQWEFRLRRHDGLFRWIVCHGAPYYSGQDRFAGYIGSGIDVTEIKSLETARKGTGQDLARSLVELIPWPAYAKDSSGRFIVINRQGSELLGRSKDEFSGKTSEQLGLEHEFSELLSREQRVLQSGSSMKGTKDASSPDERLTIAPWGDSKTGPNGIIAVETSRPPVRLPPQSRHDFNNLIAIIRMYSEFLGEQKGLDEKLRAKVIQISEAAERLRQLIDSSGDLPEPNGAKGR